MAGWILVGISLTNTIRILRLRHDYRLCGIPALKIVLTTCRKKQSEVLRAQQYYIMSEVPGIVTSPKGARSVRICIRSDHARSQTCRTRADAAQGK